MDATGEFWMTLTNILNIPKIEKNSEMKKAWNRHMDWQI